MDNVLQNLATLVRWGNWDINKSQTPICTIRPIHFELIVWHINILLLLHFHLKWYIPMLTHIFCISWNQLKEKREGTVKLFHFVFDLCNSVRVTSKKSQVEDICCSCFCIISFIPKANARWLRLWLKRISYFNSH